MFSPGPRRTFTSSSMDSSPRATPTLCSSSSSQLFAIAQDKQPTIADQLNQLRGGKGGGDKPLLLLDMAQARHQIALLQGQYFRNIVQMGDLGNFRMSLKTATATATEKEFKASCIDKGKVLFYPGSDLRKLCKTLDYTLYKNDSSADSDKDPLPDDGDDNQGGSGSGVTPDPSV